MRRLNGARPCVYHAHSVKAYGGTGHLNGVSMESERGLNMTDHGLHKNERSWTRTELNEE